MVEKKKGKKRKDEYVGPGEDITEKPSKDEYELAKWMRKKVPIKKTKFMNHVVEYFTASRAIDAMLEAKYRDFATREEIVDYMQVMLEHKFFHRARKIPVAENELRGKRKDKKGDDEKKKVEKEKGTDAESSVVESKGDNEKEKEKRKRKIRLEMHTDQRFVDSLDAYVWIYDPIPFHYWIFGALLVLAAIGVCLFPLWPPSVRLGVYYLSVAAAGFLVFIILLVVLRLIIFCLVWILTAGKHHIRIFPNLTEDVGFFASFKPLYKYEYKGNSATNSKKKKKKSKDSDAEEEKEESDPSEEKSPLLKEPIAPEDPPSDRKEDNEDRVSDNGKAASESESESSQRSSTGKDFEMVDGDELES